MVFGAVLSTENTADFNVREKLRKQREDHARLQKFDYSHVFQNKSSCNLIQISCIIIGIEFAYAAETAFVSPLLLEIGIEHEHMTMIWSLPPIIGFILAPLMGSLSDKCRLSWGRRRPIILILSIILLVGLILVAWGSDIGKLLGDDSSAVPFQSEYIGNNTDTNVYTTVSDPPSEISVFNKWTATVIVIGTIFLDFGSDNCQAPARAYLLDVCVLSDHAKGLSVFTVMAGFGGFLGYVLGAIDWEETGIGLLMGGNVKTVFSIVCVVLITTCAITLTSYREIPLQLMEQDPLLKPLSEADVDREKKQTQWQNKSHQSLNISKQSLLNLAKIPIEPCEPITFAKYLKSILVMPKAMKILCFAHVLAWMGNTSYTLYFTDFVAETVFLGDPTAPPGSAKFLLYQAGLRFGCWGMAIFALSCAFHSMLMERLILNFGIKKVNIGGLLSFSIGMLVLAIFPTHWGVLVWSISAGIMYSTIFTIPYLLIANYHASGVFKSILEENMPLKQTRGLGTDIAILSSMMFVAQITISLCIGPLITLMNSTCIVIYAAGILGICATLAANQVIYFDCE